ncbi:hypothetical protein V6Z12_D10G181100, partial [Gossypium hirsutum]
LRNAANCSRCFNSTETTNHVFRDCPFAVDVWYMLGIRWTLEQDQLHYKDWMQVLFKKESNHQIKTIVCAIWGLWTTINKVVHENKIQSEASLVQFIIEYLREIEGVNKKASVNIVAKEH